MYDVVICLPCSYPCLPCPTEHLDIFFFPFSLHLVFQIPTNPSNHTTSTKQRWWNWACVYSETCEDRCSWYITMQRKTLGWKLTAHIRARNWLASLGLTGERAAPSLSPRQHDKLHSKTPGSRMAVAVSEFELLTLGRNSFLMPHSGACYFNWMVESDPKEPSGWILLGVEPIVHYVHNPIQLYSL